LTTKYWRFPLLTREDLKEKYGFEDYVIAALEDRQIDSLLLPQEEAIRSGLLNGKSLIISASSSTGKTLIAELAIVKLASSSKALFVVPLKALAEDKFKEFEKYYGNYLSIGISTGDRDEYDDRLEELDVLIATYERAEILTRTNSKWTKSIGLLIVDEFHHVGDEGRGPVLEFLITRLLQTNKKIQLLCLSAVVADPEVFQKWLGMDVQVLKYPDYRPVPLRLGVLQGGEIAFDDGEISKTEFHGSAEEVMPKLVTYEISTGRHVLIFASSRWGAQQDALALANEISKIPIPGFNLFSDDEIQEFIYDKAVTTDVQPELVTCLKKGVAFHHAGLSINERAFIEEAFKGKKIVAIFATTTLAEGINFPADTTIFETLKKGHVDLSVNDFRNMAGRAGRIGFVDVGEAIILASTKKQARIAMDRYIKGPLEPIISQLIFEKELRRNLIILLSTGQYRTFAEVVDFFSKTFFSKSTGSPVSKDILFRLLKGLQDAGFVRETSPTALGAVCASRRYDPFTIQRIIEAFKQLLELGTTVTDFTLLHLICSTSDFENSLCFCFDWEPDNFTIASVERASEVAQTSYNDREHLKKVFKTALMLEAWIKGKDTQKDFRIYPADVQAHHAERALWLLMAIPETLNASGLTLSPSLANQIDDLKEKLRYGVPETFLPTARVFALLGFNPLSRRRILRVGELHIDSVEDIIKVQHNELSKALGSPALAKRVLDDAGRLSNDPSIISRHKLLLEAEQNGFQGPVNRLFNATNGVEYEEAVYRILKVITNAVVKPSLDRSFSPDFIIAKPSRQSISIIIKNNDTITIEDIGHAVTRTLSEKSSTAIAIIGRRFSPEVKRSVSEGLQNRRITLLTESALIRTLLLSKIVRSEAVLVMALEAGGFVDEGNINEFVKSAKYDYDPKLNIFNLAKAEKGPSVPSKKISADDFSAALRE
jgi:helicase